MKQQDGSQGTAMTKYQGANDRVWLAGRVKGCRVVGAMLGSLLGSFKQGGEMPYLHLEDMYISPPSNTV